MEPPNPATQSASTQGLRKWIAFTERVSLIWAGVCVGIVLYLSLFPAFYYMNWIILLPGLWVAVLTGHGLSRMVLGSVALGRQIPMPPAAPGSQRFLIGLLVVVTGLACLKVPLRASFWMAKSEFEQALVDGQDDLQVVGRWSHDFGLYHIASAERRCHDKERIYFKFQDDSESAIIYSETGIEDLCYNSGNKGHLSGNWYWMKED